MFIDRKYLKCPYCNKQHKNNINSKASTIICSCGAVLNKMSLVWKKNDHKNEENNEML